MTDAKHIKRDYGTNIERLHVPQEYAYVAIHRLRKDTEQQYLYGQVDYSNADLYLWKAWNALKCKDDGNYKVEFDYYAPRDGLYRLECLYSSTQSSGYLLKANIYVDGVKQDLNEEWGAFPTDQKRNTLEVQLKKGTHHILYHLDDTIIWLGSICREVYTYHAYPNNEGMLTLKKANFKTTGPTNIDEFSFTIMYEDWFRDENYGNPNMKFNPSGYIFDYRDEVNFYVKTDLYEYGNKAVSKKFKTLFGTGPMRRFFGGYISTLSVDDKMTEMTINCAGRMKDAELKHTLAEIAIAGGTEDYTQYSNDELLRYPTYTKAIQHMCNNLETGLSNNIPTDSNYLESEKNHQFVKWNFKKDSPEFPNGINDIAFNDLYIVEQKDNGILLRNSSDTKFQSITLYDSDRNTAGPIDITEMPNFFIEYEMLEPKWEETVTTTSSSISGDGSMTWDQCWSIARSWVYGGWGSHHDPTLAWNTMGTTMGHTADCYDCTAWLFYVLNYKVGVPARDICGSGGGKSGTHHVIQVEQNGQWVIPAEMGTLTGKLRASSGMKNGNYMVCRSPDNPSEYVCCSYGGC